MVDTGRQAPRLLLAPRRHRLWDRRLAARLEAHRPEKVRPRLGDQLRVELAHPPHRRLSPHQLLRAVKRRQVVAAGPCQLQPPTEEAHNRRRPANFRHRHRLPRGRSLPVGADRGPHLAETVLVVRWPRRCAVRRARCAVVRTSQAVLWPRGCALQGGACEERRVPWVITRSNRRRGTLAETWDKSLQAVDRQPSRRSSHRRHRTILVRLAGRRWHKTM